VAENNPVSLSSIARTYKISPNHFERQYKEHLSGYDEWDQKESAEKGIIFPKNITDSISIDETAISNGELYTILTNKKAHGKKGALIAMCKGTSSKEIIPILSKMPLELREKVKEVTLDMSVPMSLMIKATFPNTIFVIDRFHVQKLVTEAVQYLRILIRQEVMKSENEERKKSRLDGKRFIPVIYSNGDSKRQLVVRSRYLLFKPSNKWSERQKNRAEILFREYPSLEKAYNLSMMFRSFYEHSKTKEEAKENLDKWYKKIELKKEQQASYIDPFLTLVETIKLHENNILNYFNNRSTNASAESFNAKIKGFRSLVRGVRDQKFFLFRIAKLFG